MGRECLTTLKTVIPGFCLQLPALTFSRIYIFYSNYEEGRAEIHRAFYNFFISLYPILYIGSGSPWVGARFPWGREEEDAAREAGTIAA